MYQFYNCILPLITCIKFHFLIWKINFEKNNRLYLSPVTSIHVYSFYKMMLTNFVLRSTKLCKYIIKLIIYLTNILNCPRRNRNHEHNFEYLRIGASFCPLKCHEGQLLCQNNRPHCPCPKKVVTLGISVFKVQYLNIIFAKLYKFVWYMRV